MIYFSLLLYDLEKVSRSNPETLDLVPTVEWTSSFKRKSFERKKAKFVKKQKRESKPKKDGPKVAEVKEKYFHCHVEGH